jgi:hypothetical protein
MGGKELEAGPRQGAVGDRAVPKSIHLRITMQKQEIATFLLSAFLAPARPAS